MHTINNISELALFYIDNTVYGVDISVIQEINKNLSFTKVYNSPVYIKGILNLRGQIVTVVDLRVKFGCAEKTIDSKNRVIIVRHKGENVGLLVDSMEDIVEVNQKELEHSVTKGDNAQSGFYAGLYKMTKGLVIILDVEEILHDEVSGSAVLASLQG